MSCVLSIKVRAIHPLHQNLADGLWPAVEAEIENSTIADKEAALKSYTAAVEGKSNADARDVAADILGHDIFWDCDRAFPSVCQISVLSLTATITVPRTREGYYHYDGGVEAAIKRSMVFAPHADIIWLETKKPDLEQAKYFARKIRAKYPGKYD